jgi:poly-gamma-glutamate synthesis protein (capsule biosynthesis protein)
LSIVWNLFNQRIENKFLFMESEHMTVKSESALKLVFMGDIYLGGYNSLKLCDDLELLLTSVDLKIANLESPITSCPPIESEKILLCSQPGGEEQLGKMGIGLLSLANNHVCDHDATGLQETCDRLDKVGLSHIGAGQNLAEAIQPKIYEIKGIRLGFLAYAWEGTQAIYATANNYGCAPLEDELVLSQIRHLKTQVDHVIVLPHWGYCDFGYPTNEVVELGEKMLDAGAIAVVGHHSHVLQGCRKRNDAKLIAYSLGNFYFAPYCLNGDTVNAKGELAQGAVLEMTIGPNGSISVKYHFTRQANNQIMLDSSPSRARKFQRRCCKLVPQGYATFWKKVVLHRTLRRILHWFFPWNWIKIKPATFKASLIMIREMFGRRA